MLMNTTFLGDSFSIKWQSRGYTWKELELLLSHELSHYRHHDLWYNPTLPLVPF